MAFKKTQDNCICSVSCLKALLIWRSTSCRQRKSKQPKWQPIWLPSNSKVNFMRILVLKKSRISLWEIILLENDYLIKGFKQSLVKRLQIYALVKRLQAGYCKKASMKLASVQIIDYYCVWNTKAWFIRWSKLDKSSIFAEIVHLMNWALGSPSVL